MQGGSAWHRACRQRGRWESASPHGACCGRAGWPCHKDRARPRTLALADQTEDGQKLRGADRQRKSPRGAQVSRAGAPHPPTGRTENRLRVYHLQDVSDRHQLDAQPPSSQPLPREGRRSHCAAGPEGSRLVLRAGRPACRQSVGLSEPRAILQRRTEGAECHWGARAAPHPRFPCTALG